MRGRSDEGEGDVAEAETEVAGCRAGVQARQGAARGIVKDDVRRACENQLPRLAVNQELQPAIQQFHLPFALFDELIKGCEMDLEAKRYENYEQLELYCHRVASVVGLLSIEIFGYKNSATRDYAVYLGKALQLTNILRDIRNDAEKGRIYLPQSELKKHNISEEEIFNLKYSDRFCTLAASFADRAKKFYRLARQALPAEDRHSMVAAELMGAVYWQLLQNLERQQFNVFGERMIRINRPQKLLLILRSWLRFTFGATTPNYGTP